MLSSLFRRPALLAVLAVLAAAAAPVAARADDGAGIGVARINFMQGSVAVQRGDSATSTAAALNAPVLGADYVTTGAGSRAEIQLDGATAVRLGPNVQLRFTHLDAGDRELQLAEGTVDLRVLRASAGRAQIDTPSVAVRADTAGSYRITVDADGRTFVTVRSGRADVVTPQVTQTLLPGTTLLAQGPADQPSLQTEAVVAADDFDRFNADRDARELRALGDAYVPPGIAGVDDLYAYGRWVSDPTYGTVWVPTYVAAGWAPYRDGRWVWEDTYGWTWLGYEPWGWAPYHYGRWLYQPAYGGWVWVPGPSRAVVTWSPALVAFVTFGGGTSFGFGSFGWVPLAPFEPFTPWWRPGGTVIVNRTTIINNTTVVNNGGGEVHRGWHDYANARYGLTAIDRQRFLAGRFDRTIPVTPALLKQAQVVHGAVPLVPTDANLRYSEHPVAPELAVRPATFHRTFAGTAVIAHRTPIETQRAALRTSVQALPASDPWSRFATSRGTTAAHGVTPSSSSTSSGSAAHAVRTSDPWARFGTSSRSTATRTAPHTDELSRPVHPVVHRSTPHPKATGVHTAAPRAHAPKAKEKHG